MAGEMRQQLPANGAIPIQTVWQILGQKEWQLQMALLQSAQAQQEAATLRQRLTEALAELVSVQEQHTITLMELAALRETVKAEKLVGGDAEEITEESELKEQND